MVDPGGNDALLAALQACWDEYHELMPDELHAQVKDALGVREFVAEAPASRVGVLGCRGCGTLDSIHPVDCPEVQTPRGTDLRCEHGFQRVCGVCDPYVASRTDPRDVAWPSDSGRGGA